MPNAAKIALAAASTVMNAVGTIQRGQAAAAQATFQANALRRQAAQAEAAAAAREAAIRRRRHRDAASLRARLGAAGIETSSGSALLALEALDADAELAALAARHEGELRAADLQERATLTAFRGRTARRQAALGAGSSLLRGGSRLPGS